MNAPWLAIVLQQQPEQTVRPDTVAAAVVRTPLPGGVGAAVRAAFSAPQWLQLSVLALLLLGIIALGWLVWRRHRDWWDWFVDRPLGWKLVAIIVTAVAVTGAASVGAVSWRYTQHNNDFCVSCHVMGDAWSRFQESEHRTLGCHDCHQQPITASLRQVYLWVAERPEDIPPHAKVPTATCEKCHNQETPDSSWQRVASTAGHAVHLRGEDADLAQVECVTCHGAEVHHVAPVDRTCAQSGCHDDIELRLGDMAGQTALHCTVCHDFTVPAAEDLPVSTVRRELVPAHKECLSCHSMRDRLQHNVVELDPETEPHGAVCGTCHAPHEQREPADAFESCATAECHARADTLTQFHRSVDRRMLASCGTCHKAHSWKAESSSCLDCHESATRPVRPPRPPT